MVQLYKSKQKTPRQPIYLVVDIDNLNQSGAGVGRYKGKVIFVKGALPAEQVKVRIISDKKNIIEAEVVKIIKASPVRVTPQCEYYEQCGGCHLQHLDAKAQLTYKQEMVQSLFVKAGWPKAQSWLPPISDSAFHYRKRARLACFYDHKSGQITVGLRAENSKKIISIEHCQVLSEPLSKLLIELKPLLNSLNGKKYLGHIDLNQMSSVPSIKVYTTKLLDNEDVKQLSDFAKKHKVVVVTQAKETAEIFVDGAKELTYAVDNVIINYSLDDFTQVNTDINHKMVTQAIAWLNINKDDQVLDLYCGLGNFSLPIALQAKNVVGIEGIDTMVMKAQHNAQRNAIKNCEFIQANLDEPCDSHFKHKQKIILDPARAGAESVCQMAGNWQASHVLYISCNPNSLARDGKYLLDAGFKVEKICLLDMFPQTSHVETMALFTKY